MSWTAADFRLICAWCETEIRGPERVMGEDIPESHGVCHCCAIKMGMPEELLVH